MASIDRVSSSVLGTTQTIAYDATVPITNAFGAQTRQIRVVANSACHIHIYDSTGSATATAADPLLPALWIDYYTVTPGQKISAIKAATNGTLITATAGTLWVTEMT
jgi:hypothetical protein